MNFDMQTILGIVAAVVAVLFGTGKLDLNYLLSFLQKKEVPLDPEVDTTAAIPTSKEAACAACLTLLTYCIVNDDEHVKALTTIAKSIYKGTPHAA